jgi:hypothetical protein
MAIFVSISLWLLLATALSAGEPALPNAIYRFEIRPSLEKLNLTDKLASFGTPCSFTRQESDGSVSRVIVCSDELANYLATLQMPIVMLTFESKGGTTCLAAVQNKGIEVLGRRSIYFIRKEDQKGRVFPDFY